MRSRRQYGRLPYNPRLEPLAKKNRKMGILSEALMWRQLHKRKFKGLDFDRQKIIGNYIVDFYCAERGVVVEVDGESHEYKGEHDEKRERFLESLGLTIIHISDQEVLKQMDEVMEALYYHPALRTDGDDG